MASGNVPLEATLHALYEVAERDATHRWATRSLEERRATRLRLDTVVSPPCRSLFDAFEKARIAVMAWDVTAPGGVPAVFAGIVDLDLGAPLSLSHASGSGAHLNPSIALLRALSEAAQTRVSLVAGGREDVPRSLYERIFDRSRAGAVTEELDQPEIADLSDDPVRPASLGAELELVLDRVRPNASQVVAVNLSRPDLGVPVVKVVAPGLRPSLEGL